MTSRSKDPAAQRSAEEPVVAVERVLCVCVGNISRSPMMCALLQRELGDGFVVESAGLETITAFSDRLHAALGATRSTERQ